MPRTAARPRPLETVSLGLGAALVLAGLACFAASFETKSEWSRGNAWWDAEEVLWTILCVAYGQYP